MIGWRNVGYGYDPDRRKVIFYTKRIPQRVKKQIKRAHHELRQRRLRQLISLLFAHPEGIENTCFSRKLRIADNYFGLVQQLIDDGLVGFEGLGPMWARVYIIDKEKLKRRVGVL